MCTNDVAMRSHQRRNAASSSPSHPQAAQRLGCPSENTSRREFDPGPAEKSATEPMEKMPRR
jgi:hypothetical protein